MRKTRDQEIQLARELLKPSEVKLHRVPNWLRSRLLKMKKAGKFTCDSTSSATMLHSAICATGVPPQVLDHWGTTTWYDEEVLVTEPYSPNLLHMAKIAKFLGVGCKGSGKSWHYPGYTTRILFTPLFEEGMGL